MPRRQPPLQRMNCATGLVDAHIAAKVDASVLRADWPAPPGVHAFTTLRGPAGESVAPFDGFNLGLRCGDDPGAVLDNRMRLRLGARLPSPPRWLRQVHGTRVMRVEDVPHVESSLLDCRWPAGKDSGARSTLQKRHAHGELQWKEKPSQIPFDEVDPEADAAVTSEPGVVLAILTADCLPVLFCADDGSEVAAAHAGWRGLAAGVLEATVAAMRTPPERLLAWLGPAAGPQHYEVGAEVRDAFVSCDADAASAFAATRPGHWHVDLYALARMRLAAVGVTRVHGGGLCTISDPARFFSHRRDQRTGRMASLVWIEPAGR